jgi:hypothetical protein
MLELQKLVLQNVAYNKGLFRKELLKSCRWLNSQDLQELYKWLENNFWETHKDVIQDVLFPYEEFVHS